MHYRDRIATSVTIATLAALGALTQGCGGAPDSLLFVSGSPDGAAPPPADLDANAPAVDSSVPVVDSAPPPGPGDSAPPPPLEGGPLADSGPVIDAIAPPPDANPPDAGPWSPLCPNTAPTLGTPCTQPDLQCEYGDAWWSIGCDVVVQCRSGSWASDTVGGACTPQPGTNSSSCPATYGDVPQDQTCSPTGLSCLYSEGICSCGFPFGPQPPVGGGLWSCLPGQGCPFPRPRLGSACSGSGMPCDYETCSYEEYCSGGTWQAQPAACAGGMGQP
jgi:hypothetical protein